MTNPSNEERIAALEAEIKKLKREPQEPFKPKTPWQPIDYTAQMRMPPSAVKAMAGIVGDVKRGPMTSEEVASSWARSRISGPGGFGPPDGKWDKQEKPKEQPKPAEPPKDTRSPQTRMFDDMVAHMVGGPNSPVK